MSDLVAYDDLDALGSEVTSELQSLEQDLWHRLLESYGSNPDDGDRGVGLEERLSGPINPPSLARDIEIDFKKDPRVDGVVVTVSLIAEGVYQIDIAVDGDAGELNISLVGSPTGVQRLAA